MKTWLFTWNEKLWNWDDDLYGYKELKKYLTQIDIVYRTWTCGSTKSISKGDRIYLIKLGSDPRGIVASGYAASTVFEGTHWDDEKRKQGKTSKRVYVGFDKILDFNNEPILSMDKLKELDPDYRWASQSSGVSIPEELSNKLSDIWNKF